jgi:hypothetical protein
MDKTKTWWKRSSVNEMLTDKERIARLEKLVNALLHISKEVEDFWPYTTADEMDEADQLRAELKDNDAT